MNERLQKHFKEHKEHINKEMKNKVGKVENVVKEMEKRNTETAEALVREHALQLADHVAQNVRYLD